MKSRTRFTSLLSLLILVVGVSILASLCFKRFRLPELVSQEEVEPSHIKIHKLSKHFYMPPPGLVPDKKIAVEVALVVLKKVYGEKEMNQQIPFKATLSGKEFLKENRTVKLEAAAATFSCTTRF